MACTKKAIEFTLYTSVGLGKQYITLGSFGILQAMYRYVHIYNLHMQLLLSMYRATLADGEENSEG